MTEETINAEYESFESPYWTKNANCIGKLIKDEKTDIGELSKS